MPAEQFDYTIEAFNTDPLGRAAQTDLHYVRATTPQAAAAKTLHEQLFPIGNVERLRAKVWRLGPDGERIETKLYLKA